MVDKRNTPEAPGEAPRRKRTAPTIDLTATEVPTAQAASSETAPPSASVPPVTRAQSESDPEPHAMADTPAQPATAEEAASTPPPPPPPPPTEPEDPSNTAAPPPRGSAFTAAIAGGVIGAALIAIAAAGLWYAGYIPSRYAALLKDVGKRVASLEKRVNDLQNRPAPNIDHLDKSVAALTKRVATIENRVARQPAGDSNAAQQIAKIEKQVAALDDQVGALNKRSDEISAAAQQAQQSAATAQKAVGGLQQNVQSAAQNRPPSITPDQFSAMQKRVGAIERSVEKTTAEIQSTQHEIAKVRGEAEAVQNKVAQVVATGSATRLAVSATSLRDAVLSGTPFAPELAQAKSLAPDPKMLAPLDRFAQSGLPAEARLAAELREIIPDLRKVADAEVSSGSFLDRLQANASKLVRITPAASPSGNDVADVVTRLQREAAQADIDGALGDLAKLPDKVRAPAQGWIAEVKARQAALAAVRRFAAQSARALDGVSAR
jgi:hypothetical protein